MKSINESGAAFIVRIWVEPREIKDAPLVWRGVIEHVGRKDRVYFDHLDKMISYVARYLEEFEIKNNSPERTEF